MAGQDTYPGESARTAPSSKVAQGRALSRLRRYSWVTALS